MSLLPVMSGHRYRLRRASCVLTCAVMVAAGAHAGDVTPQGGPATATSGAANPKITEAWPARRPGRLSVLVNASLLSEVQDHIGRSPDRSDQGGACGGIVVHDWDDENLRVITLGDRVQSIAPLVGEPGPR